MKLAARKDTVKNAPINQINNNMKLYATVTSERATKGQGGDNLLISITGEDKKLLWQITVDKVGNTYCMGLNENEDGLFKTAYSFRIKTKGEKKKGECDGKHDSVQAIIACKDCAKTLDDM